MHLSRAQATVAGSTAGLAVHRNGHQRRTTDDALAAPLPATSTQTPPAQLPNGKTDLKALPEPSWNSGGGAGGGCGDGERKAPEGPTEEELLAIWEDILGLVRGAPIGRVCSCVVRGACIQAS